MKTLWNIVTFPIQIFFNVLTYVIPIGLALILILLLAMGGYGASRFKKPMQIPEAHGMTYQELIQNRIEGYQANAERYQASTTHCMATSVGALAISLPLQVLYTYAGVNPDSTVINYIDPRDIQDSFIPEGSGWKDIPDSWWWTFEKFTWSFFVDAELHTPSKRCRLPFP